MLKDKIADILKVALLNTVKNNQSGALTELTDEICNGIIVERSKKIEFGDYSCNVSYLARFSRLAPPKIAQAIVDNIDEETRISYGVSIIGGFINFKLPLNLLNWIVSEVLSRGDEFGSNNQGDGLKVLLEYVSANPTGPLHIGHGRWAALGSCIESLLKFSGYDVKTEFYINDAGVQIKNLGHSVYLRVLQELDPEVYFPLKKEEDPRAAGFYPGEYVKDIAKLYLIENPDRADDLKSGANLEDRLYTPDEAVINEMADFAKPIILEQQKILLNRFKTGFDIWYSELDLHNSGKVDNILSFMKDKGALYESEGAVWFASSRFADTQDRVVRKSDGSLTYLTADIAYHKDKYDRGYEHLINIWGADHHGYVPRMKSAVEAMGYNPDSLEVLIGQMVNLIVDGEQVRMGKRKKMLTLEDLVDDVGVDATRFWMISRSSDTTLDFDVELAKSATEENPVFYVQYAHARCCSILRTAVSERLNSQTGEKLHELYSNDKLSTLFEDIKINPEIIDSLWQNVDEKQQTACRSLILHLEGFKDVVYKSSRDRSPHYIARYLQDLAGVFHSFYAECRVLNLNPAFILTQELQDARLSLIAVTRQVLCNGLKLLGVDAPQSM